MGEADGQLSGASVGGVAPSFRAGSDSYRSSRSHAPGADVALLSRSISTLYVPAVSQVVLSFSTIRCAYAAIGRGNSADSKLASSESH